MCMIFSAYVLSKGQQYCVDLQDNSVIKFEILAAGTYEKKEGTLLGGSVPVDRAWFEAFQRREAAGGNAGQMGCQVNDWCPDPW